MDPTMSQLPQEKIATFNQQQNQPSKSDTQSKRVALLKKSFNDTRSHFNASLKTRIVDVIRSVVIFFYSVFAAVLYFDILLLSRRKYSKDTSVVSNGRFIIFTGMILMIAVIALNGPGSLAKDRGDPDVYSKLAIEVKAIHRKLEFLLSSGNGDEINGNSGGFGDVFKDLETLKYDIRNLKEDYTSNGLEVLAEKVSKLEKQMRLNTNSDGNSIDSTALKDIIENELDDIIRFQDMLKREIDNMKSYGSSSDSYQVQKQIDEALKIYSADRIGKRDYVAESVGGRILPDYTTKYSSKQLRDLVSNKPTTLAGKFLEMIGVDKTRLLPFTDPRNVIRPSLLPGDAFCFPGDKGKVTIRLSSRVEITHVTIDHASPLLVNIENAPRKFSVHCMDLGPDNTLIDIATLVSSSYNPAEDEIWTFSVTNRQTCQYVTYTIENNWGGDHTCAYRFRVHSF
eukprot:TRINITY_DN672_c0_g2_i2.p1 TRINITY_DN672_c0_g2~~TRINITY_DN672_c0_g2_i2.p1  ORF type:complete len:466 (+),score=81.19 TRINITY_DN672_c0_g2_i2:37-1398(+)